MSSLNIYKFREIALIVGKKRVSKSLPGSSGINRWKIPGRVNSFKSPVEDCRLRNRNFCLASSSVLLGEELR